MTDTLTADSRKTDQTRLFDLARGEHLKEQGMALATDTREHIFNIAKDSAYKLALRKGEITVDDVYAYMESMAAWPSLLGPAAGSIFKGKQWECIGWRKSTRASNHARSIRVWRLRA